MPLADLLMERFKVRTRAVENPKALISVGTTPEMVLGNNPNRLAAVIQNLSANVMYLGLTNAVSGDVGSEVGIRLDANGGQASLVWDEDFQMTAWAWWIVATGAGSRLFSLAVVEY